MAGRVVGVKEAHRKLPRLLRDAEAGEQIVVSRKGKPIAVVIGAKEYNSIMATIEEMADPRALRALREAQEDSMAGRIYTYEEVFGHPPPRLRRKMR
ncbi:MAG: type II toxin-antitoxin system Phd/YefM family antitoxin [Candidatus Hodarchaeaceae archaeon]|nr:type II toxin-antitoxin system Phd/YefM family antitoxin [Candidatus Hodarchaeaceae archaeon]